MVKKISVDTFLNHLGTGISQPVLVIGDDLNRYILKKEYINGADNKQLEHCMFINEFLSFKIASHLEVPIPEAAIAHIDERLIDNDPEIRFVYKFKEGFHFASQQLSDVEENLMENYQNLFLMGKPYTIRSWNAFFNNIKNKNDISRIIALDLLIANFDRFGNTGNLLISSENDGRKVYAIDHGHAFFGPVWNTHKIKRMQTADNTVEYIDSFINLILKNNIHYQKEAIGMGEVFRSIETAINLSDVSNHSFIDVVATIEKIDEELLDEWLHQIPDSWFVDKPSQIAYYKKFVLKQKDLVRLLIQRLAERKAFTNYRGGVLEWESERQAGIQ